MTEHRYRRRAEVPAILQEILGVTVAKATLDKLACIGGGPPVEYFGTTPVYREDRLLAWGRSRIRATPRHLGAPAETGKLETCEAPGGMPDSLRGASAAPAASPVGRGGTGAGAAPFGSPAASAPGRSSRPSSRS
jgi:hypothetical protein